MKKSFKTVTAHLLVFTLAVGSLGALPAGSVPDEHPLSWARTNGVVSMMDEYYRVFDVAETDAMYVAPEKRVKLW